MTFLNATLMFGMLAAGIPIAVHLLSRREPKKVLFPSIRFLTQRYETNRSRLRIRRWWLLALRVAAIAAVAFALSRPVIHQSLSIVWLTIGLIVGLGVVLLVLASLAFSGSHSVAMRYSLLSAALISLLLAIAWGGVTLATGQRPTTDLVAPVALAIVIDNSATSQWNTADDDRIARIHSLANWIVSRVPRSSRLAVIDRSATAAAFALDAASAIAQIDQTQPLTVTQPIQTRIDAALRLVRSSELDHRVVIVISDLSAATWKEAIKDTSLRQRIESEPAVSVTLFDLGRFAAVNRRLSELKVSDPTPPAATPVAVSATIDLTGEISLGEPDPSETSGGIETSGGMSVTAELQMYRGDPSLPVVRDGVVRRPELRSVDRTSLRVSASGSTEVVLTVPPLEIGTHHGQIRLVGDDPLSVDDVRYFSIEVLPASTILIVGDDDSESRVLGQTITAPLMIDDPNAKFDVQTIRHDDFPVVRLSDFEAILLIDPPNAALQDARLAEFIERGGGVLVALGPTADADSDAMQATGSSDSIWPTRLRRWRVPQPGTFLQGQPTFHPAWSPLNDVTGGVPWNDFRISQYWQIKADRRVRAIATFAGTEHPAVVELVHDETSDVKSLIRGRVIMLTTPIPALAKTTRPWNELFSGTDAWPAFLLTRQITDYLTRRADRSATLSVGQPYVLSLPASGTQVPSTAESMAPADDRSLRRLQLFPPGDASPVPLDTAAEASEVIIDSIQSAGTYWVRGSDRNTGFSANLPGEMTELNRVDSEELLSVLGTDHVRYVNDQEQIDLRGDADGARVPLHSPAMLLAIVVFLVEQVLSNRFYRKSSAAAASSLSRGVVT